ncbi:MAG TPA: class I SAM-dependent methyltransferase, partial [Methanotrichaceae archaeon]|nr:class I SAM-dependent methyltransferase [Methanotrichaceae archaeon]
MKAAPLKVLDVGSYDMNGSYKPLFTNHNYIGLDICAGPNVDLVVADPYHWPIEDAAFDAVISGQALEHIERPWQTLQE